MSPMFEFLRPFSKILVTGPQRSGTTIAAKMIAADLGLGFFSEEYVQVHDEAALRWVIQNDSQFVLQCPALQHAVHAPSVGGREDVAVVYMERPADQIHRSEDRIGWSEMGVEFAAWGVPVPRLADVKRWAWYSFQNRLILHPFVVVYSSLAKHPLWVPPGRRASFHARQTSVEESVWSEENTFQPHCEEEMKTLAVAAALCLGASTSDLKYDLQVREAFTAFEAQVEAVRTETGVTNPDRLVPVLMPRRSLWRNEGGTGFLERLNNDFFVEKLGTGEAKLFRVVERREDYIELALVEGGWMTRLYEDHLEVKSPGAKAFKTQIGGKWER